MEDVLRWTLFIVGTCAIAGVLVHGLWVSRKTSAKSTNKVKIGRSNNEAAEPQFSLNEDDDLGVGPVRVISSAQVPDEQSHQHFADDLADTKHADEGQLQESRHVKRESLSEEALEPVTSEASIAEQLETVVTVAPGKVYASVVTQPKPEYAAQANHYTHAGAKQSRDIPEPPTFLLKGGQQVSAPIAENPDAQPPTSQPSNASVQYSPRTVEPKQQVEADMTERALHSRKNETANRKRKEPKFADDQMNIDFDEQQADSSKVSANVQSNETKSNVDEQPQEVLVLNVKTADDEPIQGASLLPMLLTLGFKFGDQDIFHRHVNANGKGPVLFSLANMFKPGVFDIDHLETFTTQGVSLFMILPIEGDPHQVFNMMHNAARKIADEFNGQILDGRRSMLTKQGLQQYVERIREFERKRMIHR
ncbi:cell division protein ZipA [Paraglaciecola sp. 20A4]|uniref:cell division protein ZipA n=1 Tax=Paraglaciecola sp. 20A4 TaxID=2687288 RepID=UPI00140989DB|nr:cell division protein ZipA [Paraglaciecola sp. 20A4]